MEFFLYDCDNVSMFFSWYVNDFLFMACEKDGFTLEAFQLRKQFTNNALVHKNVKHSGMQEASRE